MRRRGFTIVELIIVITIMAILLTLGVVNLRRFKANAAMTNEKNGY
jgi:prepilin-type N-terminal cleavage/methylation domain-containing protein